MIIYLNLYFKIYLLYCIVFKYEHIQFNIRYTYYYNHDVYIYIYI